MPFMRLPKPEISAKLEFAKTCLERLITGAERAVFILGPPGVGKDVLVKSVFGEANVPLILIQDASLFGVRAAFMANPTGYFWLNDYDRWLTETEFLNFLKHALEPDGDRLIGASNADTLRTGNKKITFNGRLVVTSNVNLFALSARSQDHVGAVTGRGKLITLPYDPLELLKYLDWWVCEENYFRTPKFREVTGIRRPLSLYAAQSILDFLHKNAWRLPLSLRTLNSLAKEVVLNPPPREIVPDIPPLWQQNCAATFQLPLKRNDLPPPAPRILRRCERRQPPCP